jgi:hypothetical protein
MTQLDKLSVIDKINLEIKCSTIANAGNGLFALREFAAGEPITQYCGQMICYEKAKKRRRLGTDSHIRMHLMLDWCIDGARTERGERISDPITQLSGRGGGAFVNHKAHKHANARFDRIDNKKNRDRFDEWRRGESQCRMQPEDSVTILRATKKISAGEEIFADYGKQAIE